MRPFSFSSFLRSSIALIVLAGLFGSVKAQLPSLGGDEDMPVRTERKIGDRIAREIYQDPDYLDDPVLGDYVQSIWRNLISAAKLRGDMSPDLEDRFAWKLFLARDFTVNAFALPGGYLGIHTGLIALSKHRSEVAAVLAHELSHITQRHIARGYALQNRQQPLVLAAMLLGAATLTKNPELANAAIIGGQAAGIQAQLNYTRDMEREADRVGFGILAQAGFEAAGMVSMFELLSHANRLNDNGNFPYLRTHPLTSERIAEASNRIHNHQASGDLSPDPLARMMGIRARILSGAGPDVLASLASEPFSLSFTDYSQLDQLVSLYGATLASSRLSQHERTQALYRRLVALLQSAQFFPDEVATVIQLLGLEIELRNTSSADQSVLRARAETRIKNGPSTSQAVFQRSSELLLSESLIQLKLFAPASERLPTWLSDHPDDAHAWRLLAVAQRGHGRDIMAVRSDAEALSAELNHANAIERLRAAQQLPGFGKLDLQDQSVLHTRFRAIEELRRNQSDDERMIK